MSNKKNNAEEENFELFGESKDDNLKELLARGAYKWTNKTTGVLAIFLLIVASASAGAWYGHRQATNSVASTATRAFSAFRSGGGFAAFGGGTGAAAGGTGAAAGGFGGSTFGGRGVSATVASVKGNTVTLTVTNLSSTTLATAKAGDRVTVRVSGAGGFGAGTSGATGGFGATTGGLGANTPAAGGSAQLPSTGASTGSSTRGTKGAGGTSTAGTTGSGAGTAGATGGTRTGGTRTGGFGGGGAGGGLFSNPAFSSCLKDNGVTITPGTRPDRTDPKVAAALQTCFAKLGGGFGGPGAGGPGTGGGFTGNGNGAGAAAPTPAPTSTP